MENTIWESKAAKRPWTHEPDSRKFRNYGDVTNRGCSSAVLHCFGSWCCPHRCFVNREGEKAGPYMFCLIWWMYIGSCSVPHLLTFRPSKSNFRRHCQLANYPFLIDANLFFSPHNHSSQRLLNLLAHNTTKTIITPHPSHVIANFLNF